jgi:DNA invertase Pin-like site-specific DNA recombinase
MVTYNAKRALTENEVKRIREMLKPCPYTVKDVAKRFSVSRETISRVVNRKSYAWVP